MNFRIYSFIAFCLLLAVAFGGASCKKTRTLTTGGIVTFSVDTLAFDTVFTAAGSFTTSIKIYNPQDEQIILSAVRLQNGSATFFHLNVDGFAGNNASSIKIAAHDSVYVFATVNINPNDSNNPFLLEDSLVVTLNGNNFYLPITAYGQNAHYIVDSAVSGTWLTDKPYVIMHNAFVDSNMVLNIPANCRVYIHQDSRLFVAGTLNIDVGGIPGTDSVVFQGDRLDRAYFGYQGYPGEWGGLYFEPGSTGNIHNAIFKNCGGATTYGTDVFDPAAIQIDSGAQVTMDRCVIENAIGYGILNFEGSLVASNCLVSICGAQNLAIVQGGYDSVTNCTFAGYGNYAVSHTQPAVAILNYYQVDQTTFLHGNLDAVLTNCIIYGSLDSELYCDSIAGATATLFLDNCLIQSGSVLEHFEHTQSCIFNKDPLFVNTAAGNFHLSPGSPAIDHGVYVNSDLMYDLTGKTRSGDSVDIGCYQH
jgi:hypothetical protein